MSESLPIEQKVPRLDEEPGSQWECEAKRLQAEVDRLMRELEAVKLNRVEIAQHSERRFAEVERLRRENERLSEFIAGLPP